jgi:hypothetical protein
MMIVSHFGNDGEGDALRDAAPDFVTGACPANADSREGEALRDAALDCLPERRRGLILECTVAAPRDALQSGFVCADGVHPLVTIPPGISAKFLGVVFRNLADAGIIRLHGYRKSTRRSADASPLSVWRLADAPAAMARLAALNTPV